MLTRLNILNTLQTAKPLLAEKYGVNMLALFGSYSRGEADAGSDIDLMVDFSKPIGIAFIDLADELEMLLHTKVDLVSRNGIKPKYFQSIEQELIYV